MQNFFYNQYMITFRQYIRQSTTCKIFNAFYKQFVDFVATLGTIVYNGFATLKYICLGQINLKELMDQCVRFGISSLPITLSIVGMTSIIVTSQVAAEMVKQGGGNFVGLLISILIVREVGAVMSGFAIISMIGSSLASELATMRVTEQIDAVTVLKVSPIRYLFVPRVLSGIIMMPILVVIASAFGVLTGALTTAMTTELSFKAYFDSAWLGIYMKDLSVCLLKSVVFGGTIALISCSCGYEASGGAKGVGLATNKAVVWSLVAIVIWDLIFSITFFF